MTDGSNSDSYDGLDSGISAGQPGASQHISSCAAQAEFYTVNSPAPGFWLQDGSQSQNEKAIHNTGQPLTGQRFRNKVHITMVISR